MSKIRDRIRNRSYKIRDILFPPKIVMCPFPKKKAYLTTPQGKKIVCFSSSNVYDSGYMLVTLENGDVITVHSNDVKEIEDNV